MVYFSWSPGARVGSGARIDRELHAMWWQAKNAHRQSISEIPFSWPEGAIIHAKLRSLAVGGGKQLILRNTEISKRTENIKNTPK